MPNPQPSTQPDLLSIRQTKPGCQITERYFNTKIADEYSVAFFKCIHPGMGWCSAIDTTYGITAIFICATGVVAVNDSAGSPDILWIP